MRLARAGGSYEPSHARPEPKARRRYGAVIVVVLYLAVIGLNEWRIQRHVEAFKARAASTSEQSEPVLDSLPQLRATIAD